MKALLREGRLSFQQIVDLGLFNRNRTRRRLNSLIEVEVVREENRDRWRRGQKLWFVLTEKGKSILLEKVLDSVLENIKMIDVLTSGMLSEPERLEEWKETAQKEVREIVKAEDLTLEEKVQRSMKTREAYFGAFKKALRNMHQIALNLAPQNVRKSLIGEVYVCVTEKGVITAVSEDELLAWAPEVPIHTLW